MSPEEILVSEIIESCDVEGNFCFEHEHPMSPRIDESGCVRWNHVLRLVNKYNDE